MLSIFGRMKRRRRKKLAPLSYLLFPVWNVSLLQFCTGFLLLSSIAAFHLSLVRYFDDRLGPRGAHPELKNPGDPSDSVGDGGSWIDVDQIASRQSSRKLMSESGDNEDRASNGKVKVVFEQQSGGSSDPGTCRQGRIQGLKGICDGSPCLKPLTVRGQTAPRQNPVSQEQLRQLNRIPGSLDPLHYTLIPVLTDIQWSLGVYGSVGEIGVSVGKLTALLAVNLDLQAGERIFVSDPFNCTSVNFAGLSQYEIFRAHLRDFGFEERPGRPENRIFVHRGSPSDAINKLLSEWDLPRFRLISLSLDPNENLLFVSLELVSCLIRDGGIIAIDGNDHSPEVVFSAVSRFVEKNGKAAITPLFAAGNKLFLTTTNWKRAYSDQLRRNQTRLTHVDFIESTHSAFGSDVFTIK